MTGRLKTVGNLNRPVKRKLLHDISNDVSLEKWVIWPKNTFQKLLEKSIAEAKDSRPINVSIPDIQDAVVGNVETEITKSILELVESLSSQIIKKAPFDRVSYLVEYEQTNASHEALVKEIWGPTFESAKYQWFIARDAYAYVFNNHISTRNIPRKEAIGSIVTRSLLVFREILALCRGGFPDGAMARWRTLYELYIVFVCLNKIKGKSYKLFLISEEVNTIKYEIARLGKERSETKDFKNLNERLKHLQSEFGSEVSDDYGWAAIALKKKRVNFRELEEIADHSYQRSDFRFASRLIHANHLRPDHLLGYPMWSGSTGPLVGPSPYGIHFALREAVKTLTLLVLEFVSFKHTVDTLMLMHICIDNKKKFDRKSKIAEKMMEAYTLNVDANWSV